MAGVSRYVNESTAFYWIIIVSEDAGKLMFVYRLFI